MSEPRHRRVKTTTKRPHNMEAGGSSLAEIPTSLLPFKPLGLLSSKARSRPISGMLTCSRWLNSALSSLIN
ncbi:hypothetical protein Lal_00027245 [Lupinus albus]|nr:hypothetical protein Lal_00027245 [Lupinus albus]